jgi:hypothetical protein
MCHIRNQPVKYLIEVIVLSSLIVYCRRVYSHHLMYSVVSSLVRGQYMGVL